MSNTKRIIVAVVAIAIIAGAAIWYSVVMSNNAAAPSGGQTPASSDNDATKEDDGEVAVTITYNGAGFTLSADKVASGSKVKVVNSSQKELDFDSDPHPVHTDNTELNEGLIPAGEERTFTLNAVGTWGFHNHLNASQNGKITVE